MYNFTLNISISCYNDVKSISLLIEELHQKGFSDSNIHYLLINDGSQDDTAKVIEKLKSSYDNISIIHHSENRGFGYTIKEAVSIPKTDYILYLSGDYQFKADAVHNLLQAIDNQTDYIIGIRNKREDNLYRKLLSKTYNLLISALARKRVQDVNSIFVVKSKALKDLELNSHSAFIHAEIFLKLKRNGAVMKKISIPHYPRKFGKGSGGKLKIILPTIRDLVLYSFNKV